MQTLRQEVGHMFVWQVIPGSIVKVLGSETEKGAEWIAAKATGVQPPLDHWELV